MTWVWTDSPHDACANQLRDEYGVPDEHHNEVLAFVGGIYHYLHMMHHTIVKSVRGFGEMPETEALKAYLEAHKTHEPMHHKGSMERREEFKGQYLIPP